MNIFDSLFKYELKENKPNYIAGLYGEGISLFVNNIKKENIIIVCSTLYEASNTFQSLSLYNEDVLFFPMDDFLASESINLNFEFKTKRLEVLNLLSNSKKKHIIITNLMGYLRILPKKDDYTNSFINLKKDTVIEYKDMIEKLFSIGYEKTSVVTSTGEMSVRGFIIDIFPIDHEFPIRIEFFDNIIESIRIFDPETQKSITEIDELVVKPFSEFISVVSDSPREQKYLSKYVEISNISDYLENPVVFYNDYDLIKSSNMKLAEDIFHYSSEKGQQDLKYMFTLDEVHLEREIYLNDSSVSSKTVFNYVEMTKFNSDYELLNKKIDNFLDDSLTVIVATANTKEQENIYNNINNAKKVITNQNEIKSGYINFIIKEMFQGFITDDYAIICEYDIFFKNERRITYKNDFKYGSKIKSLDKLEIGDYVVHSSHGIGIYNGIRVLQKNSLKKDYIEILYKGTDKLYIPIEKISLITKYSSREGIQPKINKLGTTEWAKTKYSLRKKIEDIAGKLLNLYAKREAEAGFSFGADTEEQMIFDSEFKYQLTRDQEISINEIKKDMEKSRPMDRLLCGDVGFGKTEVAFRAMFKAVSYSKQVMYLCPTTILSNQQYENSLDRFKNFPINIGLLNRFSTPKEVKNTIEKFKNGQIDILFGTHRILSSDIIPKDLGLLVIDEEQRFGVKHKEKIKEIKNNVDVLTLSATPIPRTLQMSMVGMRNLSLIETPPVNRYPISTYVTPYNNQLIKEAIYSELSRGGQVFILYNKISDIEKKVAEIGELVKEARITYAHGAMPKIELENRMLKFINHEFDILVCTTIIETGIDIPNANTLLVIDANNFGLSQLYQIRGRVGRTNKIAYAYLFYDEKRTLTETAIKRLQTIKDFTHLGSGFKIASRDLAIRGAGDVLGSEQAGFIDAVGIELYLRLLNDEVAKLKGLQIEEDEDVIDEKPLIEVATHIDSKYIDDNDLKIEIHRTINDINSYNELINKKIELEDRFGKIDGSLDIYMHECLFEKEARSLGIKNIVETRLNVEMTLPVSLSDKLDGKELFIKLSDISMNFRFNYRHNQIGIILDLKGLNRHFVYYLIEAIEKIKTII